MTGGTYSLTYFSSSVVFFNNKNDKNNDNIINDLTTAMLG